MPTTPVYGWTYPALSDPPNGPSQMSVLALAIEATVQAQIAAQTLLANNRPRAYLRMTSATACPNATFTILPFNAENIDSHNGHSTVTLNTRYIVQVAGDYHCSGGVEFTTNGTGSRGCTWYKNGVEYDNAQALIPTTGAVIPTTVPAHSVIIPCIVGDYIEFAGYQSAGGTINATSASVSIVHTGV